MGRRPIPRRLICRLDPFEAQRLVVLRLLALEANQRVLDVSNAGRHIAALMLQNVAEQAIIVGLEKLASIFHTRTVDHGLGLVAVDGGDCGLRV